MWYLFFTELDGLRETGYFREYSDLLIMVTTTTTVIITIIVIIYINYTIEFCG